MLAASKAVTVKLLVVGEPTMILEINVLVADTSTIYETAFATAVQVNTTGVPLEAKPTGTAAVLLIVSAMVEVFVTPALVAETVTT